MEKLGKITSKFKVLIFIFAIFITAASGYLLTKLEMNNDMLSFIPQSDPDVQVFTKTGEKFGSNYLNMIAIQTEDVFTYDNLSLIKEITKRLEALDAVDQVISLTNILDVKKIEGGLEVGKLIEKGIVPSDQNRLLELKRYTLSKEMYRGNLVNRKGNIALIIERLRSDADKEAVSVETEKIVLELIGDRRDVKPYIGGMPAAMNYANQTVMNDITLLTPLVALLIIVTLWLSFRSVRGIVLPLLTVLLSTLFAMGLMSLFHVPLTMVSSGLIVILFSTGTAYAIHLVNADREMSQQGITEPQARVGGALEKVGVAILLAGLTTMFGFLSLVTAELIPIQEFGIFVAAGIFFACFLTLFVLPSILEIWPSRVRLFRMEIKNVFQQKAGTGFFDRNLVKVADLVFARPLLIVTVAFAIAVLCIIGIPYIEREVTLSSYFPEDNPVRLAESLLEREFGGASPIVLDFQAKNIKHPAVLRLMQRIQKKLKVLEHVNNPQGVTDLIMEMNEIMSNRRVTPDTVQGVENLWLFIDGKKELKQMVDEYKKESIIQSVHDSTHTAEILSTVRAVQEIVDTSPKKWASVKRTGIKQDELQRLTSVLLPTVVTEIENDLDFAGISIRDNKLLVEKLYNITLARAPPRDVWEITIKNTLTQYLTSDTAEVAIEEVTLCEEIVAGLSSFSVWNDAHAQKLLVSKLPKETLEEDPEAIEALIESLSSVWDNSLRDARVTAMYRALQGHLSSSLDDVDESVSQRIKGDLWELVEDTVWLPEKEYAVVMKEAPKETVDITISQTGIVKIAAIYNKKLIRSQISSLGFSLVLVAILLMFQLRSFLGGLMSMIPIVFTILFNFGLMSLFSIPLDNATVMIGCIAVGIGIDYTIHIISRFKKEYLECKDIQTVLRNTITTAGKAVIINTSAVAVGFLVFLFSELEPMCRFGYLTAITMLVSAMAAITIFPASVLLTRAKFMMPPNNNAKAASKLKETTKTQ